MKGILGRKVGMTQVFTKEGKLIPVTVIETEPNVVMQVKTASKMVIMQFNLVYSKRKKNKQLDQKWEMLKKQILLLSAT